MAKKKKIELKPPYKPRKGLLTGKARVHIKQLEISLDFACHGLKHGKGYKYKQLMNSLDKEYEKNIKLEERVEHLEQLLAMHES